LRPVRLGRQGRDRLGPRRPVDVPVAVRVNHSRTARFAALSARLESPPAGQPRRVDFRVRGWLRCGLSDCLKSVRTSRGCLKQEPGRAGHGDRGGVRRLG
jgi:hypothetical protein